MVAMVPRRVLGDGQRALGAIQHLQPLADVGQAHAGAGGGGLAEAPARCRRPTASLPCTISALTSSRPPSAWAQAVLDRVLDQRLHHHLRELGRQQAVRHVDGGVQALFHAHLQDLEVRPDHRQLAAQVAGPAVAGLAHRRHAGAQQRDQVLLHHAARGSTSIRWSIEASVLNRKCGSTCACMAAMRASTTWRLSDSASAVSTAWAACSSARFCCL